MPAGTRVVLLTPAGRAAISSLLVEGPDSLRTVCQLFQTAGGQPLAERPCGRIVFGRWPLGKVVEDVVVCRVTENSIEIHCHGGRAAARAIMATLIELGCQETSWYHWLRDQSPDPLTVDARTALAAAPTERTALLLWQQHEGALRKALDTIDSQLIAGDLTAARGSIESLLGWSRLGLHLTTPWQVALVGRPNVGKSSLINALAGYRRAIVHSTPGTTRDVVTVTTAFEGWPVELADTAGFRTAGGKVEMIGIERARRQAAEADLVLVVFDQSSASSAEDQTLVEEWPDALRVFNKSDLPASSDGAPREGVRVSATTGSGLDELSSAMLRRLIPSEPASNQALPFMPAHVSALVAARDALDRGDAAVAAAALADLGHR